MKRSKRPSTKMISQGNRCRENISRNFNERRKNGMALFMASKEYQN